MRSELRKQVFSHRTTVTETVPHTSKRLLKTLAGVGAVLASLICNGSLAQPALAAHEPNVSLVQSLGQTAVDGGCNPAHPVRLLNYGIGAEHFVACTDAYRSSVEITNVSQGAVLAATSDSWNMVVHPPTTHFTNYAQRVVGTAVRSDCDTPSPGPCRLIPGARLVVTGTAPENVKIVVTGAGTTELIAAQSLAKVVQRSVTTPGQRFAGDIVACADAVGRRPEGEVLEDKIRYAFTAGTTCYDLAGQIRNADGTGRAPTAAADDVLREALTITKPQQRDLVLHHLTLIAKGIR